MKWSKWKVVKYGGGGQMCSVCNVSLYIILHVILSCKLVDLCRGILGMEYELQYDVYDILHTCALDNSRSVSHS